MKDRPNIVLIMSDQHSPHIMGCAGDSIAQTPNLDSLASSGARFTNAYCASPLCLPSRMSFMTGQYPININCYGNEDWLCSTVPTFAHNLGAAGYETVLCGRMHFVGVDQFHGFERRIFGDTGDGPLNLDIGPGLLTPETAGDGFEKTNWQHKISVQHSGYGRTGFQAYDKLVTDKAREFITSRAPDDRPYCLVVGYVLPHNPYICSKKWFDYYWPRVPQPQMTEDAGLHPILREWRKSCGCDDINPEQAMRALTAYYGLVSEMDENIGNVIDSVRDAGGEEETVFIYCSDHGEMAGKHALWWKCTFYEESAGVPLIVSYPVTFPSGVVREELVNLIDVGPTMLDLTKSPPLQGVDGRSLCRLLSSDGPDDTWENLVYSECAMIGDDPACMIREGAWKLNYYHKAQSYQLFNLDQDPAELHDLAGSGEYEDTAKMLLSRIQSRWSGERILEGIEKSARQVSAIMSCGHDLFPHATPAPGIPNAAESNEFNKSQLDPAV